ncbi:sulfur carrier protein ThiS [Aeromonas bestiarum]|uniref:sulfur carrier protein ThiS n=1 Tax=Aeromonas bestiarum TaxID=105751 RepID=UPI0032B2284A
MKIRLNDSELVLTTSPESQISVAELLAAREVAPQGVAVALNGAVLPRSRWPDTRLSDGDQIHLFTAIAGG